MTSIDRLNQYSMIENRQKCMLPEMDSSRRKRMEPKKWEWKKLDGFPKRPLHAYNCFYRDERKRIIDDNIGLLGGLTGLSSIISQRWKHLPMELKEPYLNEAKEEKELYNDAVKCWKKENAPRKKRIRKRKVKTTEHRDNEETYRTMSHLPSHVDLPNFPHLSSSNLPARLGDEYVHPTTTDYGDQYYHHWFESSHEYPTQPFPNAAYSEPLINDSLQITQHPYYNGTGPHYSYHQNDDRLTHPRSTSTSPHHMHTTLTVWHKNKSSEEKATPQCRESLSVPIAYSNHNDFHSSKYAQQLLHGLSSDSSATSTNKDSLTPLKSIQTPTDTEQPTSVIADLGAVFSEHDSSTCAEVDRENHHRLLPRSTADIHLAYFPTDKGRVFRFMQTFKQT